ncbi:HAD-IIA family hydrolase [Peribacillus psychrosaccharolyticus]|uniref:HAD-IIA family hydrolase n=1 Tax=Peribacillus psychrosaccharolyticus TaxID=1407 RepID=UPI003D28A053
MLEGIEGVLIDLDGTVYRGSSLIPGAYEAICHLRKLEKKIVFLSNRGNFSREMCRDKLNELGIKVETDEILLSSTIASRYLKDFYSESKVWTLADQGLRDELVNHGINLAETPQVADFLLISLHENLLYADLNNAFKAVQHGARILATNADKMFPSDSGLSIDVAGMIGAIEATTEKKVEKVFGKPSKLMVEAALDRLGVPAEKCMMIGDSLESDIRMGNTHGMRTLLVLTGNTKRADIVSLSDDSSPDIILDSLEELIGGRHETFNSRTERTDE